MKHNVIGIYHKDCIDGTTAAAIFLKKYPGSLTFPMAYGYKEEDLKPVLEEIDESTTVFTLDCSMCVKESLEKGATVISLDHHIGIKDEMGKLASENKKFTFVFDNTKSGATVAWSYFFPDEEPPRVALLVEDADIWKWKLKPESSDLNALSYMFQNNPKKVAELFIEENLQKTLEKAKTVQEFTEWYTEEMVTDAAPLYLPYKDKKIPLYNTTFLMRSAIVSRLLDPELGVAIGFIIKGDGVKMSVRGKDGSTISALEVAQHFGGNGHRNAAGIPPMDVQKFFSLVTQ